MLQRFRIGGYATFAIWLAIGLFLPTLVGSSEFRLGQLEYILSLLMLATGLNIVLGYAGQLFLGPSALFGVAGYAAALVSTHNAHLQSLWIMCVIGVGAAVAVGAIFALPALRIGGFYLGMVTLFLALVVPNIADHWAYAGGDQGLTLVTDLNFVQNPSGLSLYRIGVGILAASALYSWLIANSRLGRKFAAITVSGELASSVGITGYRTKVVAFLLAAVPMGLGGAYYFYAIQFMNPSVIQPSMSIDVLAGMTIGGGGTVLGPIIGTGLVGAASQFLGGFNKYQGIVYGAALVIVAIGAPTGLVGLYSTWKARLLPTRKKAPPAPVAALSASAEPVAVVTDRAPEPTGERDASKPGDGDLVVTGVARSFGGVRAVDGVDLRVTPGVVHALVGPNGSGKTTLVNLISGFYRLHAGEITWDGKRLDSMRPDEIARLGFARTFQTPKLLSTQDALANVVLARDRHAKGTLAGSVLHTPWSMKSERVSNSTAYDALSQVGLADECYTPASLLPHGTQRQLEIARAIALEPRFLLLDEPAAGLSAAEVGALSSAVREMAASGVGVLLIEHNLPVVFGLADEVTVLHQGKVVASGTPAEVSANEEVVRIYLGREHAASTAESRLDTTTPEGVV